MNRLSSVAFISALAACVAAVPLELERENSYTTYCTPSLACWPTSQQWSAFDTAVKGQLLKVTPWASPCYNSPGPFDAAQCSPIEKGYSDGFARASVFGSAQTLNWESCGDEQCWLQTLNPTAGPLPNTTCSQGRIAPYAVNLTTANAPKEIAATIAFARKHNIKLTIKNTGHEFLGRSTGQNTLGIWTHNLQDMTVQAKSPFGGPVMYIGAGVVARDAYQKAHDAGYSITLGAYGSVGIAGGFAQGGGHGPLGPKYGLAVDNIVQYSIVTADGVFRTVNQHDHSDLFFALRGGGGGSWGVVTEVVYKLHPATEIQTLNLAFTLVGNVSTVTKEFLGVFAIYQTGLTDMGFSAYTFFNTTTIDLNFNLPSSNRIAAQVATQPIVDYVVAHPEMYTIINNALTTFPSLQAYVDGNLVPGAYLTPVAFGERISGRLIPRSLFTSKSSRAALADAIVSGHELEISQTPLAELASFQIYATGPPNTINGKDTGVNTAWRSSLWEVVYGIAWFEGIPAAVKDQAAQAVSNAANGLRALTPGGGCYYSEADVLEPDWQTAFFGANYPRLLSIKHKYDPNNIWNVWKGVGWNGESDPAYSCYAHA